MNTCLEGVQRDADSQAFWTLCEMEGVRFTRALHPFFHYLFNVRTVLGVQPQWRALELGAADDALPRTRWVWAWGGSTAWDTPKDEEGSPPFLWCSVSATAVPPFGPSPCRCQLGSSLSEAQMKTQWTKLCSHGQDTAWLWQQLGVLSQPEWHPLAVRKEAFCGSAKPGAKGHIHSIQTQCHQISLFLPSPSALPLPSPLCERELWPCWKLSTGLKPRPRVMLQPQRLCRVPNTTSPTCRLSLQLGHHIPLPTVLVTSQELAAGQPDKGQGMAPPPKRLAKLVALGFGRSWKKDLGAAGGETDKSFPDKTEVNKTNK